jgi:DNA-directed RNA polymerase subunit RPC12/RpoP
MVVNESIRHGRKPDPEEPYRYVCPDCAAQVNSATNNSERYYCHECGRFFDFEELYDKRNGVVVGER